MSSDYHLTRALTCNSAMHLSPILQLYRHSFVAEFHQKSRKKYKINNSLYF